jgi:hypothetical protein
MQSIQNSFFPKISSLLHSPRQRVLIGQSPARPDNIRSGMDPGVFKPPTVAFFPNSFSLSGQGLVVGSLCKTSSSGDRWIQGLMRGLPRALFLRGNPLLHPLRELIGLQASKMLVKRDASRRTSHDGPSSDDSSSQGYDFVIAPCPRRAIRKANR